jgi:tripartite-type tricarboxylate transporter receptor subunit TctC
MRTPGISERTTVMNLPRRQFLRLTAGAAALPAVSRIAKAQAYPTRPVRIVVGYAPGGVTDIVARLAGQILSERLGQPFVVENRPGASGTIADQATVNAPHDGYTLVLGGLAQAINVTLYDKLNFLRDVAPVAGIIRTPLAMEVNPTFPAKTVPEFIAYAKANPGKINIASGGNGSPSHLFGELFKMMTGLDMVHVPYRGTALALTDLLGGQVQVVFDAVPSSVGHIRANRLRALAVTTAMRSDALPEVPIMSDFVPGYEASAWLGLSVPKNTPPEIIDKLNREINAGLADPKIQTRLAEQGGTAIAGSAADYRKLFADETEKWGKVIRAANIRPE